MKNPVVTERGAKAIASLIRRNERSAHRFSELQEHLGRSEQLIRKLYLDAAGSKFWPPTYRQVGTSADRIYRALVQRGAIEED